MKKKWQNKIKTLISKSFRLNNNFCSLGEPRPGLITKGRDKIGFSPLPRCTYLNTDLYGDDVGDGKGISTGSATGCKEACAELDACQFWTFKYL